MFIRPAISNIEFIQKGEVVEITGDAETTRKGPRYASRTQLNLFY